MIKHFSFALIFSFSCIATFSQSDNSSNRIDSSIFQKIAAAMKSFNPDTSDPPADKISRKIIELRNLKGAFNINEAVAFKIEEDRQKNEHSKVELQKLFDFFTTGNGKRWLNNATTWIYRSHFTYGELKQLVKFYKTTAGKKMADNFPLIMIQTLAAGEMIKGIYSNQ